MKVMFLDESGTHNLSAIDPCYPVFVLGGVIVEEEYAESEMRRELNTFKRELFGEENLILHTADITRARNGFESLKDETFRQKFYDSLNKIIELLEYKVVACAIKTREHLAKYPGSARDPYLYSLEILVERFCFEIRGVRAGGKIIAESRGPTYDRQLMNAWENIRNWGTRFLRAEHVRFRICSLEIREKTDNLAGLQLADLVVTPIGRHVIGKPPKKDFRIIEKKLRCDPNGDYHGRGLIIRPRT